MGTNWNRAYSPPSITAATVAKPPASIRESCSLEGVQPANLRINLLFFLFPESELLHGLQQQCKRLCDRIRLLPIFQLSLFDLLGEVLQYRVRNRVPV